jgi:hypothetical protein
MCNEMYGHKSCTARRVRNTTPATKALAILALIGLSSVPEAQGQWRPRPGPAHGLPEAGVTVGVRPDTVAGGGINQAGRGNAVSDGSSAGASGSGKGIRTFDDYDLDGDGAVSKAEAAGHAELMQRFDRHDADRNGRLTRAEFAQPPKPPAAKKTRKAKPSAAAGASARGGSKPSRRGAVGEQ